MLKVKLGVSVGDLNGIGLEIILKTFKDQKITNSCMPIVFGSSKLILNYKQIIKFKDSNLHFIKNIKDAQERKINIIDTLNDNVKLKIGKVCVDAGKNAFKSLQQATKALKEKEIDVLVTAPINKYTIQKEHKSFIGHTEFLENNFEGKSLMIMVSKKMKIAFVTSHIPLDKVKNFIFIENIVDKSIKLHHSLIQDFGIRNPKIAILGLNPHAGENGLLGSDEKDQIIPAIKTLKNKNILAFGPFPADSFFTKKNLTNYDGILSMYHDQGLTAFKTLSFNDGVNYTAGLNIIRTSPVHGTAYEISGKGIADEKSFKAAVYMAYNIYKKRSGFIKIK